MSDRNLAEELGFARDARLAVVHVDDLGMCHASNLGGFEVLDAGPATCGSLMVPCAWFAEAAAMALRRPEVDLGVHLTLTSEWDGYRWSPVAGAGSVPSLCDGDGCLYRSNAEALAHATVDDVERELRAQIEKALACGIDVTHLDAHMGTALMPPLLDVYGRLLQDYRLPGFILRPRARNLDANEMPPAATEINRAVDRIQASGVPILDGFDADSLSFGPGEGLEHNIARLRRLQAGVNYLITHCAVQGDELEAITPDAHCRDFERQFYGGERGRKEFAAQGIETMGMRPLRDLMRRRLGSIPEGPVLADG